MGEKTEINEKRIAWRSPSNIALVKYWGKKENQIPANPSISLTLEEACSVTSLDVKSRQSEPGPVEMEFWFEGEKNEKFKEKILNYLNGLMPAFPELGKYRLEINSRNTFPHSSGIASSASGMSALGLCLADLLFRSKSYDDPDSSFLRGASRLSRLASGSACRSVFGGYTIWGEHPEVPGSSDEYAIPLPIGVHKEFQDMRDAILLVSNKEKSVSSRAGHALMNGHAFATERYKMANENIAGLTRALAEGDWSRFVDITEMEALVLHGLMMSSFPSFILFEPNTIFIVKATRQFRKDTGIPVCFTLDAGPNVHLLYPGKDSGKVSEWIKSDLLKFCLDGLWIDDRMGKGPNRIE